MTLVSAAMVLPSSVTKLNKQRYGPKGKYGNMIWLCSIVASSQLAFNLLTISSADDFQKFSPLPARFVKLHKYLDHPLKFR